MTDFATVSEQEISAFKADPTISKEANDHDLELLKGERNKHLKALAEVKQELKNRTKK